jgi:sugar/nucleoside kinase (ribokinase family)|tara:strand:+ start:681 stop:797 length:117 start_codon:yes stop_codon:yes gene_type:complete
MDIEMAARLGTAAASWCITGMGATETLKDFETTIGLLD